MCITLLEEEKMKVIVKPGFELKLDMYGYGYEYV